MYVPRWTPKRAACVFASVPCCIAMTRLLCWCPWQQSTVMRGRRASERIPKTSERIRPAYTDVPIRFREEYCYALSASPSSGGAVLGGERVSLVEWGPRNQLVAEVRFDGSGMGRAEEDAGDTRDVERADNGRLIGVGEGTVPPEIEAFPLRLEGLEQRCGHLGLKRGPRGDGVEPVAHEGGAVSAGVAVACVKRWLVSVVLGSG